MNRFILALPIALLLVSVASANPTPADPGTPLALLAHQSVQKELNLSAEQITALKSLASSVREGTVKADDALATMKKSLKPEQLNRLKEISYQVRGGAALLDEDVVTALKLTKQKQQEITETWTAAEKKMQGFLSRARFASKEARDKYINTSRKKAAEQLLGLLNAEQKKDLTKLQGKAFETKGLDE